MKNKNFLLTKEQSDVVNFNNGNLLVSASAGSGKTRVLIQRAVRLIVERQCEVSNMLICTFTNSAAEEMKSRMKAELIKLLQNATLQEQEYLTTQLEELNIANISTIHSFCLNYIKQYFYKLGIDPNFILIDENQSNYLKKQALEKTLDYFIKKEDEEFDLLFEMFNKARNINNFRDNIFAINNFLNSKIDAKAWIEKTVEQCYNTDFSKNICIKILQEQVMNTVEFYLKRIKEIKLEIEMLKNETLLKFALPIINYLETLLQIDDFDQLRKVLTQKLEFGIFRLGKNATYEEINILKQLQLLKLNLGKSLNSLSSLLCYGNLDEIKADLLSSKQNTLKLFEVVNIFEQIYSHLKSVNNQFDFNDLEKQMLKLLNNNDVVRDLKNHFKFIFVDEYQDVNEAQEKIISTISNNNLFMVGDVKQSIYLFRRCEPKIFVDKFNSFESNNKLGFVQKLNKNFRSDKSILDFCNYIFKNIMTEKTSMVNYERDAKFVYANNDKKDFNVDMKFINMDSDKKSDVKLKKNIYSVKNAPLEKDEKSNIKFEALLIANEIKNALNLEITDESTGLNRKIEFKDIAILTGVVQDVAPILAEYLKEYNIPTTLTYKFKLYQTREILGLLNFLSFVNNEQNDFALLSVLKGDYCGLTNSELAKIRLKFKEEKYLYKAVNNYILKINDSSSAKIKKLKEDILMFKRKNCYYNLYDLVQEIYEYYELENKYTNKVVIQNLNLFKQSLKDIRYNNLTDYLDYIFNFALDQEFETTIADETNSVLISTIHVSKGLEYPVIILASANREFNKRSLLKDVILSKDYGLGVKFYDVRNRIEKNTIARSALSKCVNNDEMSEKIRLLYVALTRAKNKLIIVGSGKINQFESFKSDFNIIKSKSYMELLLGCLTDAQLDTLKEKGKVKLNLENSFVEIDVINKEDIQINNSNDEKEDIIKFSEKFEDIIDEYWQFKYKNADADKISLKNTVTAIAEFEENKNNYRTKNFEILTNDNMRDEVDYMKLGTAYHKVMEMCVLHRNTSIKEIILSLCKEDVSLKEYYLQVNIHKIETAVLKIKDYITNTSKIMCEQKFIMFLPYNEITNQKNNNKILVQGMIDLIIENEDEILLIDYKTTKLEDEKVFKEKYQKQLDIYEIALKKHYPNLQKKIKKIIYSFYKDSLIII